MTTRDRFGIDDAVFDRVMGSLPPAAQPTTGAAQILAMAGAAPMEAPVPVVVREVLPAVVSVPQRPSVAWKAAAAVLLCAGLTFAVASIVGWDADPVPSVVASSPSHQDHPTVAPTTVAEDAITEAVVSDAASHDGNRSECTAPTYRELAPELRDELLPLQAPPAGGGLAYASAGGPPPADIRSNVPDTTGLLDVEKSLEFQQVKVSTRIRLDLGMLAARGDAGSPSAGLPLAGPQLNLGLVHLGPSQAKTRPMLQANVELAWLPSAPGGGTITAGLTVGGGASIDGPKVRVDLGWDVGFRGVDTPHAVAEAPRMRDGVQLITGPRFGMAIPTTDGTDLYLGTTLQGALQPGNGTSPTTVQPWFGIVAGGEFPLRRRG